MGEELIYIALILERSKLAEPRRKHYVEFTVAHFCSEKSKTVDVIRNLAINWKNYATAVNY